jgi:hypothetical protein
MSISVNNNLKQNLLSLPQEEEESSSCCCWGSSSTKDRVRLVVPVEHQISPPSQLFFQSSVTENQFPVVLPSAPAPEDEKMDTIAAKKLLVITPAKPTSPMMISTEQPTSDFSSASPILHISTPQQNFNSGNKNFLTPPVKPRQYNSSANTTPGQQLDLDTPDSARSNQSSRASASASPVHSEDEESDLSS